MLTVIFAEKEIIEKINRYKLFLKPLLENKEIAFCEINLEKDNIEDIAPDIHKVINNCDSWKALIVAPIEKHKLNPFDFTGYKENFLLKRKKEIDWTMFSNYLSTRRDNYERAIENPLMKLSFALGAEPAPIASDAIEEYLSVVSGEVPLYKLMVDIRLKSINIPKVVTWTQKYGNTELEELFKSNEEFNEFLGAVSTSNSDKIVEMIGPENVPYFTKYIEPDESYCSDPYYFVSQLDETSKKLQLKKLKDKFTFYDTKPREIICVSERCCDLSFERLNSKDNIDDFADYNLYPSNMKFLLFDILPENHKQYEQDYIKYLTFILVIAENEFPKGNIDNGFLYTADVVIDKNRFYQICGNQDARLAATLREIVSNIRDENDYENTPLDNYEAREIFESDIHINIPDSSDYDKNSMRANYSGLGLAKDCPEDEYSRWTFQYKEIEKKFTRYLREPRRLVKTAAKVDFPANNKIKDDRVRRLNEYQKEDIVFRLQEEEKNMVDTRTANLFRSDKYLDELKKSSNDIKKTINKRMSKKATIGVGLSAGAAFLMGFLPMLFSNLNTAKSFGVSAAITLSGLVIFFLIGFIVLFSFRKKLKSKFVSFNITMGSIFSDISEELRGFSNYLSHACNVMRENYVLKSSDQEISENIRIMKKHILDIERKRSELRNIYSDHFEIDGDAYMDAEPFEYDFEVLNCYDYEAEYSPCKDNVEYIEKGQYVTISVDYLQSIMLAKEKNYDR